MNIYWCGGEDIDFPGAAGINIKNDGFRAGGYARASIMRPPICNSSAFLGGEITSGFASARVALGGTNADGKYHGLVKHGSGGKGIYFGIGTTIYSAALWKFDGTTWTKLAETSSNALTVGDNQIILQISNYGASAVVKAFRGSAELCSYSGDISIAGITGFDAFGFGGGGYSNYPTFYEFIVSDLDPSTLSLVTLYPNAAGDANGWTGAYTDIDEYAISDADVVYVDSASQDAQFNLSNTPAGDFAVNAIKIVARACKTGDASVGTVALGVKSGGTVDVDAGHALTTAWATYERLTTTINGSQLTTALLDELQLNLRSAA